MSIFFTDLMLGKINTILIPTDAIFILSLLVVLALLGYFFNYFFSNQTNQITQTINTNSNLELVKNKFKEQLTLEETKRNQKKKEQPNIKKLKNLGHSQLLKLSSFVFIAIGGASILGLQYIQKSYKSVSSKQLNISLNNQSIKSSLSIVDLEPKNKSKIKKISYYNPFLSTTKSSDDYNYYQFKEKQIEKNFSF